MRSFDGCAWFARPLFFLSILALAIAQLQAAEPKRSGEQIYRQLCVECHGTQGEGTVDSYPHILAGDKSITELASLIERTMPEGDIGKCVGDDARQVAKYIYDAFYSPLAQARIKPPRIELSRLTVRQYRYALADLVGSFRSASNWGNERGLRAEYFDSRRYEQKQRKIQRVDPQVNFDYGESSPDKDQIKPEEFFVQWVGGLIAPETGEYEIIVKTDNGARLFLNNPRKPLVDAGVKSGDDKEYRETIYLLGGRAYPLRLEFFKSKKSNEKTAAIALLWKPPHHVVETIPERQLIPVSVSEQFVISTPFPPDDRNQGYERGTAVSKAWDQATTDGALETSAYVVSQLRDLAQVKDDAPDRSVKLREFCQKFAEQAFRRPLNDEQRQRYVDRQFEATQDREAATKRVVLLTLKSPRFLFREIDGPANDPYNVAARISFGLWDSLPDKQLLEAAQKNQLQSRAEIMKQAQRMAGDWRARAKLREFLVQWLQLDRHAEVSKDSKLYPDFDPTLVSDLRASLDLFLDDIVADSKAGLNQLLLDDHVYLNGRLAKFYGVDLPADAPFKLVSFEPNARSGVLSHPYLLSALAYTGTSSPIHRGVFISRSVLGRSLRPPPEAVSPLAPDLHPDLSTRERVTLQTKAQACQSCHVMINSLGFALEQFDAVGRIRQREKNKPIDASGSYITRQGELVKFVGLRELARFLADSPETHAAFVEQLFQYVVKQPILAYGSETSDELKRSFSASKRNIRQLMVDIVASAALTPPLPGR